MLDELIDMNLFHLQPHSILIEFISHEITDFFFFNLPLSISRKQNKCR
jgi:hypothetical protein